MIRYSNVPNLDYQDIYNLAEDDVNVEDSVIVMKQRQYDGYVKWFSKEKPEEDLNLRLSTTTLDTRLMTQQFVMLLKKFHPYVEEVNRFVLIIEVCLCYKNISFIFMFGSK